MKINILFFFFFSFAALSGCQSDGPAYAADSPQDLLQTISDNRRWIDADQLADRLINDDPALRLIDVRPADRFAAFSLPGADNIPLQELLNADLACDRYDLVFFGDNSLDADQAWMLARRLGCERVYVLSGGLTAWADQILQPEAPPETASAEVWAQYRFRKAVRQYFTGYSRALEAEPYVQPAAEKPATRTITVKPKKQEKKEEEGC